MSGFSNAVVGGAATLIRSAIQSANYVPATTGWQIARNGNVDMNSGTFRGNIVVGAGTVTLGPGGIHVQGLTRQWDVNATAGFLSRRFPDTGLQAQIFDAGLFLTPPNPTPHGGSIVGTGGILVDTFVSGVNDQPFTNLSSPRLNTKIQTFLTMRSQSLTSALNDSSIELSTAQFMINGVSVGTGWLDGDGLTANKGPFAATETTILTSFQQTFKANHAYRVELSGLATVTAFPNRPNIRVRQSTDGTLNLGTQIFNATPGMVSASQQYIGFTCKFIVGAADVTTFIITTMQGSGAFSVTALASPPFTFDIYDIGDAANHAHAVTIT